MSLKHNIFSQRDHLFERLFHFVELFSLFLHWPTETDSASEHLIAPIEDKICLLDCVGVRKIGILASQLPRKIVFSEKFALAQRERTVNDVY